MPTRLGPDDYRDLPWKNGGGTTRELLRVPHPRDRERFFVRLSIATVASDGPFSFFPGVDRTLALLEGEGMALSFGGGPDVVLDRALRPLAFPGEAPVEARLLGGAVRDVNLMVDREVGGATLRVERLEGGREVGAGEGGLLVVHVLGGRVEVGGEALGADETLWVDGARGERVRGEGAVALVVWAWRHG